VTLLLAFGERGNAAPFRGSGWSLPEADLTWSIGTHSTLLLPVPSGEGELLLEIHVEPFTSPEVPGQLVIVSANGTNLGHAVIVDESVLSVPVPHAAFAGAARPPASARTTENWRSPSIVFSWRGIQVRYSNQPARMSSCRAAAGLRYPRPRACI
jgi:hypothetical protein